MLGSLAALLSQLLIVKRCMHMSLTKFAVLVDGGAVAMRSAYNSCGFAVIWDDHGYGGMKTKRRTHTEKPGVNAQHLPMRRTAAVPWPAERDRVCEDEETRATPTLRLQRHAWGHAIHAMMQTG